MAIVKYGNGSEGGNNLEPRTGIKAAKKAAKHPAKKHADKHAAKHHPEKKAAKHASEPPQPDAKAGDDLAKAFHHLRRAGAVISLLGAETGGDLRTLLQLGTEQYRQASAPKAKKHTAKAAQGLLRAAEHLALAALYSARITHLDDVAIPEISSKPKDLKKLRYRLEDAQSPASPVVAMARDLLSRAEAATSDMHLQHELTKAVDGLCSAIEEGL